MTRHLKTFLLLGAVGGAFFLLLSNPSTAAQNFSDAQKEEMGAIIKDYLMENPEVIMEAVEAYRNNQEAEMQKMAASKIGEHDDFLTGMDAPMAGSKDADVTVVEFFDYNCGYCKKALGDIQGILKEDQNVRFVFREMPILGPSSKTAAQWALAAHKQGKYFEYHAALMSHNGQKSESVLEELAKDAGLDVTQMKKDAASDEVNELIEKGLKVSREIGVQGTPAFVINGELVRGYVGLEGMKELINRAREG